MRSCNPMYSKSRLTQQRFVINTDELARDNRLTAMVREDPKKLEFILTSAVSAYFADSSAAYTPSALTYYKKICSEPLSNIQLHNFFVYLERDTKELVQSMSNQNPSARDADLVQVHPSCTVPKLMLMRLLYFTIFTNDLEFAECVDTWYTTVPNKNYTVFSVHTTPEREATFAAIKDKGRFMFYCAKTENLYAICRKGISFACDSADVKAHGQGVYLTEQFTAAVDFTHAHCTSSKDDRVVFCYEAKNFKGKNILYHNGKRRSSNVYVMDEEDICLRAILWFRDGEAEREGPTVASSLIAHYQSSHANIAIQNAISQSSSSSSSSSAGLPPTKAATTAAPKPPIPPTPAAPAPPPPPANPFTAPPNSPRLTVQYPTHEPHGFPNNATKKRILMELEELRTNPPVGVIHRANHLHDNQPHSPLLVEMNIPAGCKLYKQGQKLGVTTLVFACYFPQDYPFSAVQIRVVRPRIRRHTGHVTFGGSVCADMLYANGWSPKNTLIGSLMSCLFLICDDSIAAYGQIEPTTVGHEYTYYEFVDSYSFTGNTHRWKM